MLFVFHKKVIFLVFIYMVQFCTRIFVTPSIYNITHLMQESYNNKLKVVNFQESTFNVIKAHANTVA